MVGKTVGRGSAWEVLRVFLKLGVTSFGGPIAHLGYFRTEIVERRRWLDDRQYAELVALCQFLPGPASSQVGFAIGLHRAGPMGALAAFFAFTMPSAALMVAFASGTALFADPVGDGLLSGLKIVAVAIIAQAVLGMAGTLTPDRRRAAIAVGAALVALLLAGSAGQVVAIALGAVAGYFFCRSGETRGEVQSSPATDTDAPGTDARSSGARDTAAPDTEALHLAVSRRTGAVSLVLFSALLLGLPLIPLASGSGWPALFETFTRTGSLVFGGGHVVLPLLQSGVVDTGWVSNGEFLAGYGAAQAVPGPLFTFAAYLGALSEAGPGGILGAAIALLAIFLPGFLLLVGVLPFWSALRRRAGVRAAMHGANAAVVGILAAALYTPVFTSAITGPASFALALVCFAALVSWKLPPWSVVVVGAAGGALIALVA